ncbi:MAG TPA: hypothetical protein VHM92_09290 [Allosphingosinicella sp.]|nr:hypothetical protein [Allosphingosinicella sp.]
MKLARPPGGFKISLSPGVKKLIEQRSEQSPEFARYWKDILERLRFVAHVEGVADNRFQEGCRLWAAAADEDRDLPRVRLVYLVLGDTVRIRVASIG